MGGNPALKKVLGSVLKALAPIGVDLLTQLFSRSGQANPPAKKKHGQPPPKAKSGGKEESNEFLQTRKGSNKNSKDKSTEGGPGYHYEYREMG